MLMKRKQLQQWQISLFWGVLWNQKINGNKHQS
uniref:Uncharacterized protein n=1 Tax=Rhizophora mucronata TaxID=61149 RepID=A0A2P2Q9E9_RHIMU